MKPSILLSILAALFLSTAQATEPTRTVTPTPTVKKSEPSVSPTPKPTEIPKTSPTPKPTEPPKTSPTPKPTEPPKPSPTPKPTEPPRPSPTPKPTEVPRTTPTATPTPVATAFRLAPAIGQVSSTTLLAPGAAEGFSEGFVIVGEKPAWVLVRGLGPALTALGIPGAISDPVVTIRKAQTVLGSQQAWVDSADLTAATKAAGAAAFASGSTDSALLLSLQPGIYIAGVKSASGAGGRVVLEVYTLSR